jgi:hypothetical protein
MSKVKCYYDKGQFVPIVETPNFYAYPIEVDETVLKQCESLYALFDAVKLKHATAGFPRDAQAMADWFAGELASIMKAQKRRPKNVSTNE